MDDDGCFVFYIRKPFLARIRLGLPSKDLPETWYLPNLHIAVFPLKTLDLSLQFVTVDKLRALYGREDVQKCCL